MALLNKLHSETSVKELQEYFYEILEIRGFSSQTIKDKIMLLIEEVGELAKAIRKNEKDSLIDRSKISDSDTIESEVADVFIILISICNLLNIDLFQSILGKEKINSGRKWETL
nr:MazG nucleotide pyrophosphohydrolase domain-containing protein [uncultured Cetobacterium sp.]